ncbi:MAG: hypothetical protein JNL43_02485 [Flavobacteriales bacterium]|nr:hypothetical protein [Flavobacteriales bacterium]HRH68530.1 hypothetical protein [Flavobacteriales bacterium]
MTKCIILLGALLLCGPGAAAQDYVQEPDPAPPANSRKDPRPLQDRLYFGGGVSLMFGTVTNLGIAPLVGYKIDQKGKLSSGIGLNYYYYKDNRYSPSYESSNYGWSVFSRYRVIPQAFLHAEYNSQSYELYSPFGETTQREWVPFLLVGGGYSQHLGGNSYLTFQILWDLIQDLRSPYGAQPFFSVGVGVGF